MILGFGLSAGAKAAALRKRCADRQLATAALKAAAKHDKYLFIFFFDAEDANTSATKGVFQKAMAKMTDRADSMTINITDPAESRLSISSAPGAPMPVVLAIAPTGLPTKASRRNSTRPNCNRRSSAPARPSA